MLFNSIVLTDWIGILFVFIPFFSVSLMIMLSGKLDN